MAIDLTLTVGRQFQRAAELHTDRPALDDGTLRFSYHELLGYVQHLALQLTADNPAAAAPVAIVGHLNAWTIAGMLGVLWSGRILSVLDGNLPADRLQQLLDQLQPATLLFSETLPPLSGDSARLPQLDLRTIERTAPPETVPPHDQLHTPAIITYSSGTSGTPKGVVRSQAVLLQHLAVYSEAAPPQPGDSVALLYHPAFSSAGADIYPTLLGGAAVQIIDPAGLSPTHLRDRLISADLTHLHLHSSMLRPLADVLPHDHVFTRMRAVRPSEHSDGANVARFARHLPTDCLVSHTLSSSETGPITLFQRRAGADWPAGLLPVGRPLPGITLRLLDEHGNPVAPAAVGRIEVSSTGIALGYWRDAERSAEVFAPTADPFVRTFHSSDLACLLPSGDLQLHGRADRRVKIRGHSVALDTVEQALLNLPGVAAAAAVALPNRAGNLRLFAYVSPQPDTVCDPLHLAALLRRQREAELQPQRIIVLEQLPRRTNGKIDYQALPPPGQSRPDLAVPFVAPASPLEQQIATIWADVLELDSVGIDDPFTLLGGDSIRALYLLHRLETVIGRSLPTGLLITAATVREQAALAAQSSPLTDPAPPAAATQYSRLSGTFSRLLFRAMRSIVLLLLAVGLIDRRFRRQRRLLEHLAAAYGCRQPRDVLWRRSVLVNLLLNKPFFLRPNQYLSDTWSDRYERMTAAAITPICLEGFADLEEAYHTGNGVILVTFHGAAKAMRKLVLGKLLNGHPIPTISGSRAAIAARQHGNITDWHGHAAFAGLTALKRGEVITFSSDHISRHDHHFGMRFHTQTRPIPVGFAEVALLSNAAILPIHHHCDRAGRLTVSIGTPFTRPDPILPHEQQVAALLQQYADWLASVITADPSSLQWRYLPRELALISDAAPLANHADH